MSNLVFSEKIDRLNNQIQFIEKLNDRWNPKSSNIQLAKLKEKVAQFSELHIQITEHSAKASSNRVARVRIMEKSLEQAVNIKRNLLLSCPSGDSKLEALKPLFQQIHGKAKPAEVEGKESRTLSQKGFTDRIDQFRRLSAIMKDATDYEPELEELSLAQWQSTVEELVKIREACQDSDHQEALDIEERKLAEKEIQKLLIEIRSYRKIMKL